MTTIIPVASGKGGVGKTVFTANIGVSLARAGKTVILADLDLGGSNLHTALGEKNDKSGIGNYIYKQERSLESLLVETREPRLYFIPGDSLLPGTANLPYFRKAKILKELAGLVADYVILDLGSGSSYNTIDFFLTSASGILVVTPETTSILNAYSFVKAALFRMIYRSFPARSDERALVYRFTTERLEARSAPPPRSSRHSHASPRTRPRPRARACAPSCRASSSTWVARSEMCPSARSSGRLPARTSTSRWSTSDFSRMTRRSAPPSCSDVRS
jgi:MinD-like ATPase involved in chromosome partitioning or flagellar assembly